MQWPRLWTSILALFILSSISALAHALSISVTINGVPVNCSADPCPIAGNYGNFTISNEGGTAQVRTSEGGADFITLEKARFTANTTGVNGDVAFWATFAGPPDAPPASYVEAKRSVGSSSTLVRPPSSAPYSPGPGWFTLDAFINSTSIGGPVTKEVSCSFGSCGVLPTSLNKTINLYPTFSGNRQMKGTFQFYLPLQGDYLKITSVTVETAQKAGDGGTEKDMENSGVYDGPYKDKKKKCDCSE